MPLKNPLELFQHLPDSLWMPMDSAPRDGSLILVLHHHTSESCDEFEDGEPTGRLTPYGCYVEGLTHIEGTCPVVAMYVDGEYVDESGEGWGPWTDYPAWWFLANGDGFETPVNPIAWLPIPPYDNIIPHESSLSND